MSRQDNREKQRKHVAAKKAQGLKRIVLWVQPEHVETHKIAAENPHALAQLRREVQARIEREMWDRVAAKMERRVERAFLAQKRAQVRRQQTGSNRPPERVRFKARPPGAIRNRLKAAGALYNPVAAVWELPDDPEAWPAIERLLDDLEPYGIERLSKPLDE